MLEHYPHVFRYGKPLANGTQRWAFRFSIVDPQRRKFRGRPNALAVAFCAGQSFSTQHQAAVECDTWKFYLGRYHGVTKLTWSFGTYDQFASAYSTEHNGASPEEYQPSPELNEFIQSNSDVWQLLLGSEPSGSWNPDSELHTARQRVESARNDTTLSDEEKNQRYAVLEWAKKFKNHLLLCREVEEYGIGKLRAEAKLNVDMLEKLNRCLASWRRPVGVPHLNFRIILEGLDEDREKVKELLEAFKQRQLTLGAFIAKLSLDTEDLKKERCKL